MVFDKAFSELHLTLHLRLRESKQSCADSMAFFSMFDSIMIAPSA
jgi:hypothetical protein